MKKMIPMALAMLLVAVLFACTQNTNAPAQSGSGSEPGSSSEVQPDAEPASPPLAQPPIEKLPPEGDIIKADESSVLLEMPSKVRFGETATATLINNSGEELTFGADYRLQYDVNGAWVSLNYREGKQRAVIAIAYILSPGGEMSVDFIIEEDEFTIPVGPGKYRLIKTVTANSGGEASPLELKGVFTID